MGAAPPAGCSTCTTAAGVAVEVGSDALVSLKPGKGVPFGVSISWSGGDTPALDSSTEMASVASHIQRVVHGSVFNDITNRRSEEGATNIRHIDPGALLKIHSAVRWGRSVEELRAAGLVDRAAADLADEANGNTALHVAVQNGHVEIVRYLVEGLRCSVSARNRAGNTALHMGVEYDYYKINQILVNAGADYSIENGEGHPAIQGISGSKVGRNAWDNPVTIMKTVDDDVHALDAVFSLLESWSAGDIKKEELVRVGLARRKELRAWTDGHFQGRFVRAVAKV
jgi:hypothetical protein